MQALALARGLGAEAEAVVSKDKVVLLNLTSPAGGFCCSIFYMCRHTTKDIRPLAATRQRHLSEGRCQGAVLARAVLLCEGAKQMAETCSPRKIGRGTNPLGSGVSKCRRGERRVTFFALVFQLGVALILMHRKQKRINARRIPPRFLPRTCATPVASAVFGTAPIHQFLIWHLATR